MSTRNICFLGVIKNVNVFSLKKKKEPWMPFKMQKEHKPESEGTKSCL